MQENLLEKYGAEIVTTGKRWRNGKPTDEECTIIWVHQKCTKQELIERNIAFAPSNYDVQVFTFDKYEAIDFNNANIARTTTQVYGEKHRPVIGGVGISIEAQNNPNQYFVGTLGLIAYKNDTGEAVGLTNAHVGNPQNLPELKNILVSQPGIPDTTVGGPKSSFVIGRTAEQSALYDAAIIEFANGIEALPNMQAIVGETKPETASVEVGDIITMHSRNGWTRGRVVSNRMQIKHPVYGYVLTDDIMIESLDDKPFSTGGSSGGIGVTEDKKLAFFVWGSVTTVPDENGHSRNLAVGHYVEPVLNNMNLSLTKPIIIDEPTDDKPTVIDLQYQTKALEFALQHFGTTEVKGNVHNYAIMGMMHRACEQLGRNIKLADRDETYWCSLGLIAVELDGVREKDDTSRYLQMFKDLGINEAAISFKKLAVEGHKITLENVRPGDIVIIYTRGKKTWKRHVGIYTLHDDKKVRLFGGNQSDSFSFANFDNDKIDDIVRPELAYEHYKKRKDESKKQLV